MLCYVMLGSPTPDRPRIPPTPIRYSWENVQYFLCDSSGPIFGNHHGEEGGEVGCVGVGGGTMELFFPTGVFLARVQCGIKFGGPERHRADFY